MELMLAESFVDMPIRATAFQGLVQTILLVGWVSFKLSLPKPRKQKTVSSGE